MAQAVLGALIQLAEKLQHLFNEFVMKIYYVFKFIFFTTMTGMGLLMEFSLGSLVKLVYRIIRIIRW